MSLLVSIVPKEEQFDTSEIEKEIPEINNESFGFESWRTELWGHSIIDRIGCKTLYSLKSADVYAYDDNLEILEKELLKVLNEVESISQETGIDKTQIGLRIQNALQLIKIAKSHSDKVGIALW